MMFTRCCLSCGEPTWGGHFYDGTAKSGIGPFCNRCDPRIEKEWRKYHDGMVYVSKDTIATLTAEVERLREVANIAREWVHSTCLSCKQQPMYKYRECEGDVCFAYSLMQALEGGQ